jgi:hypothetical protein
VALSESTVNRFGLGILAVSLCVLGLGAIEGGGFYDVFYARHFDFGEHHVILGVVLLGLGCWAGYQALKRGGTSGR